MQSITLHPLALHYGIVDNHPTMHPEDLIRWYEDRGYRHRHISIRAGYLPKMLPGGCVVANYNGRFGKGLQLIEPLGTSRVKLHYLIEYKGSDQ